jgi:hypothetical protein
LAVAIALVLLPELGACLRLPDRRGRSQPRRRAVAAVRGRAGRTSAGGRGPRAHPARAAGADLRAARSLEREGAADERSEIQRLQNDIRSRTRKLKYARDEFQEDFALRQNELRTKLGLQVREVIVEVAKEEKIDLVISEGLVYFSPRIDISARIIERLKQEFVDK